MAPIKDPNIYTAYLYVLLYARNENYMGIFLHNFFKTATAIDRSKFSTIINFICRMCLTHVAKYT